jgi:cytochrome oxidase Cu insertion factor (SCO1/SenC/PrrC family)
VRLADARGKVIILTFLYSTCRDLCPAQANDVATAMGMVGSDRVVAYAVSVDPVGDTPERARAWLKRRGLYGGPVEYLLGTRDELRPVWVHYGITPINATRAEARAAAAQVDAFLAANPNIAKKPFHYKAPPQPTEPPPGADDAYPDPADLAYRGRARHIAGWDFEHSAYVMLIDKHGTQRLGIPFEALDPPSLARDLRALLSES